MEPGEVTKPGIVPKVVTGPILVTEVPPGKMCGGLTVVVVTTGARVTVGPTETATGAPRKLSLRMAAGRLPTYFELISSILVLWSIDIKIKYYFEDPLNSLKRMSRITNSYRSF